MKPVSALARGDIKLAYDRAVAHDVEDVGDMLIAFADYICNMEKQRDELLAALEQFATWGRMQHKAQSKGGHATFDMLSLKDEIDLAEAAIASIKGQSA